jgi:hypothetical protein
MSTNLRLGTLSRSLGILLVAGGLVACTSQAASPAGTGGTSVGSGGSTGTGGAGGLAVNGGVLCPLPMQPLITDFTYVADGGSATAVHFGDDSTTFSGNEFVYPSSGTDAVTSDVTGSSWHLTGTLDTYSGFGLSFDNCSKVDASAYKGISFTISGSVPMSNLITMDVGILDDTIAASWLDSKDAGTVTDGPGACFPVSGTNQYSQTTCADPIKTIPVTTTATTVSVLWTDFTGGKPKANVLPNEILTIAWFFPPPTGAGTATAVAYPVDITIDNLSFIAQ